MSSYHMQSYILRGRLHVEFHLEMKVALGFIIIIIVKFLFGNGKVI